MANNDQTASPIVNDKSALDAIFLKVLVAHGWKPADGYARATKEYRTAVGIKEAFAYANGKLLDCLYYAEYVSQGNNILSTSSVLIQKPVTEAEAEALATAYAKEIDAIVADSYAVRLLRHDTNAEPAEVTLTAKGFDFLGVEIRNPTLSPCGRFLVDPKEAYGFFQVDTGGGCTALQLNVKGGGHVWLSDGFDSAELPTVAGQPFVMGFYDSDGLELGFHELKVGVPCTD